MNDNVVAESGARLPLLSRLRWAALVASVFAASCTAPCANSEAGDEQGLRETSPALRTAHEARANEAAAVAIMPLGDSITHGAGSSTTSSYRAELWQRMVGLAGYPIDFVGSQRDGQLPDIDHEGHSGWRIDQIAAKIDGWLATSKPQIVLLHIGTNDMNQNYQVGTAPDRLNALIDQILAGAPGATVVVAQVVPALDGAINGRIATFNAAIPGIVQSKVAQGKRVRMVDMFHALSNADLADTLHPNDSGYAKMASLWYASLERILADGREWPHVVTGLEAGQTAPAWLDTVEASTNVGGYPCCGLTRMESSPRNELAHGGVSALMYSGSDKSASGPSYSYNRVFDVHIPISTDTVLSYWIYPQQANGTFVALDFAMTDGSNLRDSGVVDQFGARVHPQFQGEGKHLAVNQWNLVRANLGRLAGKTIDRIHLGYDQPANTGAYRGYVDDIRIVDTPAP
ncbi:SGNH/GDSL hydrolase family protein [Pendulispora albinea]|uniref:SGNH/GDSL hydrolase family protein n=1 Tax=Pendulispora albinea TaxID=2741071 RepID=A0ABZ2M1D6_9BACT